MEKKERQHISLQLDREGLLHLHLTCRAEACVALCEQTCHRRFAKKHFANRCTQQKPLVNTRISRRGRDRGSRVGGGEGGGGWGSGMQERKGRAGGTRHVELCRKGSWWGERPQGWGGREAGTREHDTLQLHTCVFNLISVVILSLGYSSNLLISHLLFILTWTDSPPAHLLFTKAAGLMCCFSFVALLTMHKLSCGS